MITSKQYTKEGEHMLKDFQITKEQQEDIGEMTNILILLPVPDREILMSNARVLKAREELAKKLESEEQKVG
jgi:hypothetical protein|uniref:Uncharacterized protein n=1 Tax=Podoviridae sp. ctZ5d16 TaxID=2825257 RepID=A0A8S5Q9R8_9CAUD|nr:MAG TPA: hypothetical protein [Podoviridae sp. ctZ5d16]